MCLNTKPRSHMATRGTLGASQHSRGFLIPVAAMIVVGIAVLAIAISRMSSQTFQASIIEAISAQAFYAAESGASFGMTQLMFNVDDRAIADVNCDALSTTVNFNAPGLRACSAVISCTRSSAVGSPLSFYTIRSEASCGGGDLIAERIIEVSSFL